MSVLNNNFNLLHANNLLDNSSSGGLKRNASEEAKNDRQLKKTRIEVEIKRFNGYLREYERTDVWLASIAHRIYRAVQLAGYFANLARMPEWDWKIVNFNAIENVFNDEAFFIHSQMNQVDTGPVLANALIAVSKRISARLTPVRESLAEKINDLLIQYVYPQTAISSSTGTVEIDNCPIYDTYIDLFADLPFWEIEEYIVNYKTAKNCLGVKFEVYEKARRLATELIKMAQFSTDPNETISKFLRLNHRFIVSQTEDPETSPLLRASLLALSERIPHGDLSHEVMSIANGIFNGGLPKPNGGWLPDELWSDIFQELAVNDRTVLGLKSCVFVSKNWKKLALAAHGKWVDETSTSLKIYGCKTIEEAIECIISKELRNANLREFYDVTEKQLEKLGEKRPNLFKLNLHQSEARKIPLFKELRTLSLSSFNHIEKEKLLADLLQLTNLQKLELDYTGQFDGDRISEVLSKLTKLEKLSLQGKNFLSTEKIIGDLSKNRNLKKLNLSSCNLTNYKNPVKLFVNFESLTHLDLAESKIDDDTISEILGHTPNLEFLDLFSSYLLGKKFAEALGQLKSLRWLNIAEGYNIPSDELVKSLAQLKNLRVLNLCGCDQIDEYQIVVQLSGLVNLEDLNIGVCDITDDGIEELLLNLENLESLGLSNCLFVSASVLLRVIPTLKKLTNLVVPSHVSDSEMEEIKNHFRDRDFKIEASD